MHPDLALYDYINLAKSLGLSISHHLRLSNFGALGKVYSNQIDQALEVVRSLWH